MGGQTVGTLCALYILSKIADITSARILVRVVIAAGVDFADLGKTLNIRVMGRDCGIYWVSVLSFSLLCVDICVLDLCVYASITKIGEESK